MVTMEDLIKAMQIFLKYVEKGSYQEKYPTVCAHDELCVCWPQLVSEKDVGELDKLGFFVSNGVFKSFRFGSC